MRRFVLLDTSGSMCELSGTRRRINVLRDVLTVTLREAPARLFAFNSYTRELDGPDALPEPSSGTVLHEALILLAAFRPDPLIVISDGSPHDPEAALVAARNLHTTIRTVFVGNDTDHNAVAFMRALAWCSNDGIGQALVGNLNKPLKLTADLRAMLAGPSK